MFARDFRIALQNKRSSFFVYILSFVFGSANIKVAEGKEFIIFRNIEIETIKMVKYREWIRLDVIFFIFRVKIVGYF